MIKRLSELFEIEYENRLIIFDFEQMINHYDYSGYLQKHEFEVVRYNDVEEFRFDYETSFKDTNRKLAIIVCSDLYVPFDIRKTSHCVNLTFDKIYPKLDGKVLVDRKINFELLDLAYDDLYQPKLGYYETIDFINDYVNGEKNGDRYCQNLIRKIREKLSIEGINYRDWIEIAKVKGEIDYFATKFNKFYDLRFIDQQFRVFIFDSYKSLSAETNRSFPVILTKTLEHISSDGRVALLVMDGMSMFDFRIMSNEFDDIAYDQYASYALIPTTTSISRQSLLSGKYPVELVQPFNVSHEQKEFFQAAERLGYRQNQVAYERGYDIEISSSVKFLCVILNDIDDLMHNQLHGKSGMFSDVQRMAKTGKIQGLIKKLYSSGFSVYITSDHGNTVCRGKGRPKGMGIDIETRSNRMLILKDFAEKEKYLGNGTFVYPGYYLDKQYTYLICDSGESYDQKDAEVLTHGGVTIDEVIVPFIEVKEVQNG